jgi:hypothetical protein
LETGISVGKEFYLDVHSKLRHNEPIFSKKFKDVVEEFVGEQRKLVGVNKSLERWKRIKVHTNRLEVQKDNWMDYFSYRKTIHPKVVNGSLLNEKYTIGSFYKFFVSKK